MRSRFCAAPPAARDAKAPESLVDAGDTFLGIFNKSATGNDCLQRPDQVARGKRLQCSASPNICRTNSNRGFRLKHVAVLI